MYRTHVGCAQWSDDNVASTMREARETVEAWDVANFTQGNDKATEAWIDSDTGNRFIYNIERGEWEQ